jgi:hypothetical protein
MASLVGLTPTGVQRHETKSQARLISRPDRGRQSIDGCGPLSRCGYIKGGEGLGSHTMKFLVSRCQKHRMSYELDISPHLITFVYGVVLLRLRYLTQMLVN